MTPADCPRVVLVVEDDHDIAEAISEILSDHDFVPAVASNGREALELLRRGVLPCVILLDLMMPVMDGWQFREAQLHDPTLERIPLVVLTAHADVETATRELAAGAFLRKPVVLDRLLGVVAQFCA